MLAIPFIPFHSNSQSQTSHAELLLCQHIKCPTRGARTFDHCYSPYKQDYKTISQTDFGKSEHSTIFPIPKYIQCIHSVKVVMWEVKCWSAQSEATLLYMTQSMMNRPHMLQKIQHHSFDQEQQALMPEWLPAGCIDFGGNEDVWDEEAGGELQDKTAARLQASFHICSDLTWTAHI